MNGIKPMKEIIFLIEEDPEELKANIMDAVGCHFGGSECWDGVL